MKKYLNRENEATETKDGRKIWLSRSCAVTSIVIMRIGKWYQKKEYRVLTSVRGKDTPDYQGYFCCPCGYLDWDESLAYAACRETLEETNFDLFYPINQKEHPLNISDTSKKVYIDIIYDKLTNGQPFYVSSTPESNKQNVTAVFGVVLSIDSVENLPVVSGVNVNTDTFQEVAYAEWMSIKEVNKRNFAFNHNQRILSFFKDYKSRFSLKRILKT